MGRMDTTPTIPADFNPHLDNLPDCNGATELYAPCRQPHAHGGPNCIDDYIACPGCPDCDADHV